MKKSLIIIILLALCHSLFSQEWTARIEIGCTWSLRDVVSVDDGESVLCIGSTTDDDGFLVKIDKHGEHFNRVVHLPGMMLCYYSAVQLDNGNYMVFGVCDDSLSNPQYQKYIRMDVFDGNLESVGSRLYDVEDDVFETFCFTTPVTLLKAILSPSGTVILAANPAYYVEEYGYYNRALQLYELDCEGNILIKKPHTTARVSSFQGLTYEPHSDNLLVAVRGGSFPNYTGVPGFYVIDTSLNVVARQHLLGVQGGYGFEVDPIEDITIDGKWIDGDYMMLQTLKHQINRSSFNYNTLYKVDSAMNVYGELRLPPYDSCTWLPYGTSTAYIDDSTIFAFTICAESMYDFDTRQANVILADKHLNLLGRKTIRQDNVYALVEEATVFNDGGCLVSLTTHSTSHYQGEPFFHGDLMKFRREDIEITWDVVQEMPVAPVSIAYPNPTEGTVYITVDEPFTSQARIQIIDAKGMKCLDSAVGKSGNLIRIDLHNLDAGLYFYKLVSDHRQLAVGKIIKE